MAVVGHLAQSYLTNALTLRCGAYFVRLRGFPSYATSKLNAIRCITPFLRLGVIDSWVQYKLKLSIYHGKH